MGKSVQVSSRQFGNAEPEVDVISKWNLKTENFDTE